VPPAPVVDLDTAIRQRAELRRRGQKVVFTNGCFDLLHGGHVRCLEASRALGDCLVVGINSDESVRRLKGSGRPVLGLDERLRMLSALVAVDYLIPFDEDTPMELICRLKPDVLTKGADYAPAEVVGADIVTAAGGRVERIPLVAGLSTSLLIERIRGGERERSVPAEVAGPRGGVR
jgi:D-beta-D-heptose 7-phosphate kinase/D-beta-D-heptose 1-phosphate adenosyltransferase